MHVKAAPLDQFPRGLGVEEKMQSRGKQEASASPFPAGGDGAHGWGNGSRSENQGRDGQPLSQTLW